MVEVIVVIAHDFKSIPQKPYKITVAGNPNSGTVLHFLIHVRRSILQQPHLKVETICQPKHENGPTDKIISIFFSPFQWGLCLITVNEFAPFGKKKLIPNLLSFYSLLGEHYVHHGHHCPLLPILVSCEVEQGLCDKCVGWCGS